jgi:hypothetical protein
MVVAAPTERLGITPVKDKDGNNGGGVPIAVVAGSTAGVLPP